jgi:hypothetical protein
MEEIYQNSPDEYSTQVGTQFPMDTIEALRRGGDPLIIEALMIHFIGEFEIGQGPDEWMMEGLI